MPVSEERKELYENINWELSEDEDEQRNETTGGASSSSAAPSRPLAPTTPNWPPPRRPAPGTPPGPPPGLEVAIPASGGVVVRGAPPRHMPEDQPLALPSESRRIEVEKEMQPILDQITLSWAPRLADGSQVNAVAGPRLNACQDTFGLPHGKLVKLVILAHKPVAIPGPEPMIAASNITHMMLVLKQEKWTATRWVAFTRAEKKYNKKPDWLLVIYGIENAQAGLEAQLAPVPTEALQEQLEANRDIEASTLPAMQRTLTEASKEEKVRMLIVLHRRMYHRPPDQMRRLLKAAGVPLATLALVEEACKACEICRRWDATGTKPNVKLHLSASFNHCVFIDLVYLMDWTFTIACDEATRYCTFCYVEYKSFESLERGFRRSWVARFGPPVRVRLDKERALAHESFGVYLEKLGVDRELVDAEDEHTRMSILDRRVQIIRHMGPKLFDTLSSEGLAVEPEDLAAEVEFCVNTQLNHNGTNPYLILHGTQPRDLNDEELGT